MGSPPIGTSMITLMSCGGLLPIGIASRRMGRVSLGMLRRVAGRPLAGGVSHTRRLFPSPILAVSATGLARGTRHVDQSGARGDRGPGVRRRGGRGQVRPPEASTPTSICASARALNVTRTEMPGAAPGFRITPILVAEGDLRFFLSFGRDAEKRRAAEQTLAALTPRRRSPARAGHRSNGVRVRNLKQPLPRRRTCGYFTSVVPEPRGGCSSSPASRQRRPAMSPISMRSPRPRRSCSRAASPMSGRARSTVTRSRGGRDRETEPWPAASSKSGGACGG